MKWLHCAYGVDAIQQFPGWGHSDGAQEGNGCDDRYEYNSLTEDLGNELAMYLSASCWSLQRQGIGLVG